jgi:thiamine pyrophosphate-dependent acetolactate synthase large subunit-like protein
LTEEVTHELLTAARLLLGQTAGTSSEQASLDLTAEVGEGSVAILAGPDVVRRGMVAGLQALAVRSGLPVVNTWGAKGVFRWDDPHHAGTAGLQARDFELAGLGEVDTLLTTGLDPDEVTASPWAGRARVMDVPVAQLERVAARWPGPTGEPQRPRLYTELAAVVRPAYASDEVPLTGARAAADLAAALPAGGLVAADAGRAGFWVARCFPTSEPGSVVVPARRQLGLAAAVALLAAQDGRRTVLVVDELDEATGALVEAARARQLSLAVEVWGVDGTLAASGDHAVHVSSALAQGGVSVRHVPVATADTAALEAVAGPIVAWT